MQLAFNQIVIRPGQNLLLKDISWSIFENLLAELGEERSTRLSYSQGMLEIMAPLAVHESDKKIIGNFVEVLLEELNIDFWALGSTTFKNEKISKAVEPDECFYIQNAVNIRGKERIDLTIDPPPELAIEIDISSRTHFDNYEKLGVKELWRYNGETLEINVLTEGCYLKTQTSYHFPQLAIFETIPHYVKKSKLEGRNATMKAFRLWINEQISA